MSAPVAWSALAAALLLVDVPGAAPVRVAALSGAGRLAPRTRGERASRWRPGWRLPVAAGCVGGLAAVLVVGGVALVIAAGAVAAAGWSLARALAGRRVAARRRTQLRTAVGVLVGELSAGARPGSALSAAAEAAPDRAAVFGTAAQAAAGAGDAAAVLVAEPDTAALGHAWRVAEETGAALSGVLGRVVDDLAAADAQRRAVSVALSGPRSSATVLAGLPVLGLALGVAMGARPGEFLLGSPAGRLVCCAGVLLDVLGLAWIAAILRKAELAP